MTTWLLILQVSTGSHVLVMPDLWSCISRSQFEVRFNPRARPLCVMWEGREA